MADYGLTSAGVNIKRADVILEEMHEDLSESWGVNTRQNPESFLNALLTNVSDALAELWEFGQDVYNSQYPLSAEGIYLDGTGQFVGITREEAAPSYYYILCTGTDGTTIPSDTTIESDTNPAVTLSPVNDTEISRDNFNIALIKIVSLDGNPLTVSLNGTIYSVTPGDDDTEETAMESLLAAIDDDSFTAEIDDDGYICITAAEETSENALVLSDNLTTVTVSCIVRFATEDDGDIYLPAGSITTITKSVTGLDSVVNVGSYIAGRGEETDTEFRQSYVSKIFTHSARMTKSIRSAILNNVQGVESCYVYENYTDDADDYGRYPHSIEVVVDGGDSTEIAEQIFDKKAAGINTYGDTEVTLTGDNDEDIIIRFNRPEYINVWFHVEVTASKNETLASDYADTIKDLIVSGVESLGSDEDLIPQSLFFADIYSDVDGISYIEITMATGDEEPEEYTEYNLYSDVRERFSTDESMIEVVLNE